MIKVINKRTYSKTVRNRKGSPVMPQAENFTNHTKYDNIEVKEEEKALEFPPVTVELVNVMERVSESFSVSNEETEKPKKSKKQPKQHKQEESEE